MNVQVKNMGENGICRVHASRQYYGRPEINATLPPTPPKSKKTRQSVGKQVISVSVGEI